MLIRASAFAMLASLGSSASAQTTNCHWVGQTWTCDTVPRRTLDPSIILHAGDARHKRVKGLGSQNLRDHMTDLELILTMLGETSANTIAKQRDTDGLTQNAEAARAGGGVAGTARRQIEKETG